MNFCELESSKLEPFQMLIKDFQTQDFQRSARCVCLHSHCSAARVNLLKIIQIAIRCRRSPDSDADHSKK